MGGLICQPVYADKSLGFQEEKLSPMKTAGYTVLGLGTIAGIVAVADSIESDSSGTKVVIGDPPEDPDKEPALLGVERKAVTRSRDMERTTLYLEDIFGVFREIGRRNREKEGIEIFLEGIDRREEYEGFTGGVYYSKNIMSYRDVDIKRGLAYGHTEAEYEDSADGSSETLHASLQMEYRGDLLESYTWLSGEYGYNRYKDEGTARYTSRRGAIGSETALPVEMGSLEIRPFIFTEVSYMRRGDIDLSASKYGSENYTSIKWGPGIEMKSEGQWKGSRIETILRGVTPFEEGNIYDKGVEDDIAPDRSTEISLEIRGERGETYLFIRGGYHIQSGPDYYRGGLGGGFRL